MTHHDIDRRRFLGVGAASLAAASLPASARRLGAGEREASEERSSAMQDDLGVGALTFDVFGTVVDWRTSIIREGTLLNVERGWDVDWAEFADRWRSGYGPAMNQVRTGELPWRTIDELHRTILDDLLVEFGVTGLFEAETDHLNRVWHRLMPWPDTVGGLNRLKTKFTIVTLSNGNISLLADMAKNAGLPWDIVLSAELSGHYKTDPEVYLKASDLLDLPPERIMMVAAHKSDLRAAQGVGFKAAWVPRPLEYGLRPDPDTAPDPQFEVSATDFIDLARQLGA